MEGTRIGNAEYLGYHQLIFIFVARKEDFQYNTVRRVMSVQENRSQEELHVLMASGLRGSTLSTEIKELLLAMHGWETNKLKPPQSATF